MRSSARNVAVVVFLLLPAVSQNAKATVPTFDGAPSVASNSVIPLPSVDTDTVVFGRKGSQYWSMTNRSPATGKWQVVYQDLLLSYDGDPAVAYVNTQFLLVCGHGVGANQVMFCTMGYMDDSGTFRLQSSRVAVGSGTFGVGTSPSIVETSPGFFFVAARGTNQQIWTATFNTTTLVPNGWWQVPSYGTGFDSDPGITTAASDGSLIVCGKVSAVNVVACATQQTTGQWSNWFYPGISVAGKVALTRSSTAIYLFGIDPFAPNNESVTYSTDGGSTWSSPVHVGAGSNFGVGPAAVAYAPGFYGGPNVLTVGRGGDNAYWYSGGTSGGWSNGWYQIQAQ